jgi:hypothetical protein
VTQYPPSPIIDAGSYWIPAFRFDAWRRFATQVLRLPTICEEPACRRARFCAPREAPCILRYTRRYRHRLPVIRKALLAELARREAEQAQA